ncbi:MAG: DinB family protein [Ferruginibacter sp.]
MIRSIALELENTLNRQLPLLCAIPETVMLFKPSAEKWSKKEVVGHIIDSAQNNIRRFIVGQYESEPKIIYNQDKWVSLGCYQQYDLSDLVSLWWLLNKHICNILRYMPEEAAMRKCETAELHTIEWLAQDYIKHLQHHMHLVLDLEPVAYP